MAVTIRDVARKAKVSVGTVSKVLNKSATSIPISEETQRRVLEAAETLGYRPNIIAQALVNKQTHTIGVLVVDIGNPYFAEYLKGVEAAASGKGYSVLVCNSNFSVEQEEKYLHILQQRQVDGILLSYVDPQAPHLKKLCADGPPFVVLGWPEASNHRVVVDNVVGGRQAVEHLISLGHERIAFIGQDMRTSGVKERLQGYREALAAHGIPYRDELVIGHDTSAGYMGMCSLLKHADVTAVMAANDVTAIGAMKAIYDAGLRIPQDISVIGYDDIDIASLLFPPLTTVWQPKAELGEAAANLLIEIIKGNFQEPQQILFQPRLVVRASTAERPRRGKQ